MNVDRLMAVLDEAGFSSHLVEGGTEITISCPLCFDEKQRLYISTANGTFICFRCDARGHLRRLLTELCGFNHNEAFAIERSVWGRVKQQRLPGRAVRPQQTSPVELPPGLLYDGGVGLVADYFRLRHLNPRWIKGLRVGYCLTGRYAHRVIVPIYTEGELRTFVARTWLQSEPKRILMPKGSLAALALFGYDLLPCHNINPGPCDHPDGIVLVEGVFDAIRMWELGYEHTLATLGAHITDQQRVLLKRLAPRRIVLLRDGDQAGREAAAKESQELAASASGPPVYIAILPEGADPESATPKQIQEALDKVQPLQLQYGMETARWQIEAASRGALPESGR